MLPQNQMTNSSSSLIKKLENENVSKVKKKPMKQYDDLQVDSQYFDKKHLEKLDKSVSKNEKENNNQKNSAPQLTFEERKRQAFKLARQKLKQKLLMPQKGDKNAIKILKSAMIQKIAQNKATLINVKSLKKEARKKNQGDLRQKKGILKVSKSKAGKQQIQAKGLVQKQAKFVQKFDQLKPQTKLKALLRDNLCLQTRTEAPLFSNNPVQNLTSNQMSNVVDQPISQSKTIFKPDHFRTQSSTQLAHIPSFRLENQAKFDNLHRNRINSHSSMTQQNPQQILSPEQDIMTPLLRDMPLVDNQALSDDLETYKKVLECEESALILNQTDPDWCQNEQFGEINHDNERNALSELDRFIVCDNSIQSSNYQNQIILDDNKEFANSEEQNRNFV